VVIEATRRGLGHGLTTRLACSAGRIAIAGLTAQPVPFSALDILMKELDLLGVRNCCGHYPEVIRVATQMREPLATLIDQVFPLSHVGQAFDTADRLDTDLVRIVVRIAGGRPVGWPCDRTNTTGRRHRGANA